MMVMMVMMMMMIESKGNADEPDPTHELTPDEDKSRLQ